MRTRLHENGQGRGIKRDVKIPAEDTGHVELKLMTLGRSRKVRLVLQDPDSLIESIEIENARGTTLTPAPL